MVGPKTDSKENTVCLPSLGDATECLPMLGQTFQSPHGCCAEPQLWNPWLREWVITERLQVCGESVVDVGHE
jgi:hypothetical protein